MSLRVPTLVKDSLLDDGQLTTRDWTIDDNSLLALINLFTNRGKVLENKDKKC